MTKSLLKMEEVQIADVCKVIATKIEDFDESILIVQIRVGKFGIRSNVNIISKSLRKKLGLRRPKLAPFVVRMDDQKNA
jgi:hypothetical protein